MTDKKELRIKAKNIRKNLTMKEVSAQLAALIRQNEFYKNAENIMLFYPTKYEVDLRELFSDNKNFYLPKVEGENLLVCPYICHQDNTNLQKSPLGIYEPCSEPVSAKVLDLVIIPALMCDKHRYRLGYGGGFYDRFITKYGQNFKTMCAIPDELYVENLPVNDLDQKVDFIITT
ncbi:5-formyltetrahydrofolate cyclo-ligase [bacterium]|nr:5-formyltetrahydrofolate cyclo-ligase [bacterium]